jgi:hypothetical protein
MPRRCGRPAPAWTPAKIDGHQPERRPDFSWGTVLSSGHLPVDAGPRDPLEGVLLGREDHQHRDDRQRDSGDSAPPRTRCGQSPRHQPGYSAQSTRSQEFSGIVGHFSLTCRQLRATLFQHRIARDAGEALTVKGSLDILLRSAWVVARVCSAEGSKTCSAWPTITHAFRPSWWARPGLSTAP